MKAQAFNPFPRASHDSGNEMPSRARRSLMRASVLAAVLAIGLPLLQIAPAVAGEVLEIPQAVATPIATPSHRRRAMHSHRRASASHHAIPSAPASNDAASVAPAGDADAYAMAGAADPAPPPARIAENSYPPDPNLGSISDYQNQPGQNGQRPSFALGGGGPRAEPQRSMTSNLILGGLLVGMVAYEIASSHHHHR